MLKHSDKSDKLLYVSMGGACASPPPSFLKLIQLLHLNQASIKNLISDLTRPSVLPRWVNPSDQEPLNLHKEPRRQRYSSEVALLLLCS